MTTLNEATRKARLARGLVPLTAAAALLLLPLWTLPALADSQPSATYTSDRTAYDRAVAVGTPSALRDFLLAYPNSSLTGKALDLLVQRCTILKPQAGEQEYWDNPCDLEALIAPAAGPNEPTTPFTDPPTEHSARDNASNI